MAGYHVIIDPDLLRLPMQADDAGTYVESLIEWLPFLMRNRSDCSLLEGAVVVMLEEGTFPTHELLRPLLSQAGLVEYSLNDLRNLVRVVAESEPFLEQHLGRRTVAASQIVVDPAYTTDRLGGRLGSITKEGLALAALAQSEGWCPKGVYWATNRWELNSRAIETDAHIELTELSSGELKEDDVDVHGMFHVLSTTAEMEELRPLEQLYVTPVDAVRHVLSAMRRRGVFSGDPPDIRAAPAFVAALERYNLQHQPSVLATVFERAALAAVGLLSSIAGAKVHPVRTDRAADAPQVERSDGSRLWRCMVTKKGAGYRLHYWTLPGGGVELETILVEAKCS